MSYDEVDALSDFASAHGITYPLLSDPTSDIIRRFGILNTLIPPDDHPWYGIPFPGTYVTNGDGVITHKFFEHSILVRTGAAELLRAALGRHTPATAPPTAASDVTVQFDIDRAVLPTGITRELHVSLLVPDGQHVYGPPVPEGLVAVSIELDDGHGLVPLRPVGPATRSHALSGTGDVLQIYGGSPSFRLPFTHNGTATTKLGDGSRVVTVEGSVRWQACNEETCGLPQRQRFAFQIPAAPAVAPDMGPVPSPGVPQMNGDSHFRTMQQRHERDQTTSDPTLPYNPL